MVIVVPELAAVTALVVSVPPDTASLTTTVHAGAGLAGVAVHHEILLKNLLTLAVFAVGTFKALGALLFAALGLARVLGAWRSGIPSKRGEHRSQ